jgi:molybdopterin converting factor subunit 1
VRVTVRLFAAARHLAGNDAIELELGPKATVAGLRERLAESCPALAGVLKHARFAVNAEYASEKTEIAEGAEVAVIPPVSGG